jgi:hypothetical protein
MHPVATLKANSNTGCRSDNCEVPSIVADGNDLTLVTGGGSVKVQGTCGAVDLCELVQALDATNEALAKLAE